MTSEKKGRTKSDRPLPELKSDRPLPELKKERDAFIQTFFRKGAQLTEELLTENTRLRSRIAELDSDNATLRAQVASDDAIRDLLKKIELLEREKGDLISRYQEVEAASSRYVDQFSEVEDELANLANLYVASYQLHSSLSLRMTLRQIKELLEQLVGARAFALYLGTDDGQTLVPIVSSGVGAQDLVPVSAGEGTLGEAFVNGVPCIETGSLAAGSVKNPVAMVPLRVEDKSVGLLAVFGTLEQKPRFLPVDFELFKLLGAHAGVALVSARLFADTGKQIPGLDGFLDLKL